MFIEFVYQYYIPILCIYTYGVFHSRRSTRKPRNPEAKLDEARIKLWLDIDKILPVFIIYDTLIFKNVIDYLIIERKKLENAVCYEEAMKTAASVFNSETMHFQEQF